MNLVRGSTTKLRREPTRRSWEIATAVLSLGLGLGWSGSTGAAPLTVPPPPELAPGGTLPLLTTAATLGVAAPVRVARTVDSRPSVAWRLPLAFEPADDRAPSDARYAARGPGYSVFINSGGALLALRPSDVDAVPETGSAARAGSRERRHASETRTARSARPDLRFVAVRFEGARVDAEERAQSPMPGRIHRLRGSDPSGWRTGLQAFGRVVYSEVYPGIDVAFYGQGRELEYDFVVDPGADPSRARLRFDGVGSTRIRESGDLVLETGAGELVQRRPVAYQTGADGGREWVDAGYRLESDGSVGFRLGAYDPERTLVIDPVLSYATFVGGTGVDQCWDIAVDEAGNAFVAGETESASLSGLRVVSTNAFRTNYQGGLTGVAGDAFVAKLAPDGTAFEWLTYLGGSDLDAAFALALGSGAEPVVVGFTSSTNFPVTPSAFRTTPGGTTNRYTGRSPLDAFVTRLRADGSGLVASTLFGGDDEDQALDVTLLGDQTIVIAGSAWSTNLPGAVGAGTTVGGGKDGFVAVLRSDLTGVVRARYLGGSGSDSVEGVVFDASGNGLHLVGITESTNLPVVVPVQSTNGGFYDLFAAGLRVSDLEATYTTYLGGSGDDYGYRAGVGPDGRPWLAGVTFSRDLPTANAWVSTNSGGADALLARLSADGKTLELSTYFGGSAGDSFWDVRIDVAGRAHLVGETASTNLPGFTPNAVSGTNRGLTDILIVRVGTDGVPETTPFGAPGDELGYAVATDGAGNAYVAGRVRSVNFPVSGTNVAQAAFGGGRSDGFVLKLAYEPTLSAELAGDGVQLSWPAPNEGFVLESAVAAGGSASWTRETAAVTTAGGRHSVHLPMSATNCVFRLRWER